MIYILTGGVQSGKTSALQEWMSGRSDVGGFLTPDVGGTRHLLNAHTGKQHAYEAAASCNEPTIEVGMFVLRLEAFERGTNWVREHLKNDQLNYIVVDELGKLELEQTGFHECARLLLETDHNKSVIFVVRDYLLPQIVSFYNVTDYVLMKKEDIYSILPAE